VKNVLRDELLVEQPARHPDRVTEASLVKGALMIGQIGLFPRAFCVPHYEKGLGHDR